MLITAGMVIVLGLVTTSLSWSTRYLRFDVRRLARSIGEPAPFARQVGLEARTARRTRGVGLGIMAAGIAVLAWVLISGAGAVDADGPWAVVALTCTSGAVGLAAVEIWWPSAVKNSSVRTARSSVPVLGDYLSPSVVLLTWSLTIFSGLVLAGALILGQTQWFDEAVILGGPVPIFGGGVIALAILTVLAVRRVLNAPQPASEPKALYWQDALRASTLSSLHSALALVSILGLMLAAEAMDAAASAVSLESGQVGPEWTGVILIVAYAFAPVYLLVSVGLVLSGQGRRDARRFRTRLWPSEGEHRTASA